MNDVKNIYELAALLKRYLKDNKPFINDLYSQFIDTPMEDAKNPVSRIKSLVEKLPEVNQAILFVIFDFLHFVLCFHKSNQLNLLNESARFGQLIFRTNEPSGKEVLLLVQDSAKINNVMQLMISRKEEIFNKICNNPKLTNDYLRLLNARPD